MKKRVHHLMYRWALLAALLGIIAFAPASLADASAADDSPPNVIIFYVDDVGWKDLGAYGSNFYETPNVDRIADEGMLFTRSYTHMVCGPSRAMLMSGLYNTRYDRYKAGGNVAEPYVPDEAGSDRAMVYPKDRDHLPLDIRTVAEAFKDEGYNTWHLGKWHLGHDEYDSENQGFDLHLPKGFDGPGGRTGGYFAPWHPESINRQFKDLEDGDYITERLTTKAVELIEESSNDPFFLYLAHYNTHAPYEAKSTDVDYFRRKLEKADDPGAFTHDNPVYAAMVKSMDESLGSILDVLANRGIDDNTILIFLSDNGARDASDQITEFLAPDFIESRDLGRRNLTSNKPLRAGKGDVYEGGIRVPMIVRYPGTVPAGTTEDSVVHTVDVYPTLLELTPAHRSEGQLLDGESLVPLLAQTGELSRRYIYGHFPKQKQGAWILDGDYKLIRFFGEGPNRSDRYELYDLGRDIGETRDLSGELPQITSRLSTRLDQWLRDTDALLPKPNPNYDPAAAGTGR